MIDGYFLGNLIGRIVFAYIAAWLVALIVKRFQYRPSVQLLHSRWGLVAVFLLFLLPMAVSIVRESQGA